MCIMVTIICPTIDVLYCFTIDVALLIATITNQHKPVFLKKIHMWFVQIDICIYMCVCVYVYI